MIEMCYYRFLDFAFHFIFFQIFQIDFSTECLMSSVSKYSIYDLRGQIAQFSIRTKAWKEASWVLWEFQIFPTGIIAQIFEEKNICYFRSPNSPWREPQSVAILSFFVDSLRTTPTHKISYNWGPILAFSNIWCM